MRAVGRTFNATTMARIGWGRGIPTGLSGWFEDLLAHVGGVVKADGTTWLLEQYTALRQLPQRIQRLEAIAQATASKVGYGAANSNNDVAKLLQAAQTLVGVRTGYPAMMASVENAYLAIQGATPSTVNLSLAGTVAGAAFQAQTAMRHVDEAETEIRAAIDHLIQTGVLTEREAQSVASGADGSGISRALLYVGGTIAGLWLLRKVMR